LCHKTQNKAPALSSGLSKENLIKKTLSFQLGVNESKLNGND
jgi:hypothetical protein